MASVERVSRDAALTVIEAESDHIGESFDIAVEAEDGDSILIGLEFLAEGMAELLDRDGQRVTPTREPDPVGRDGRGFLGRAYQGLARGMYTVRVVAYRATVTVIRFGQNAAVAIAGGGPNYTTCFACRKVVSTTTKCVLAAHGIYIPSFDVGIAEESTLEDVQNLTGGLPVELGSWLASIAEWIPERVARRLGTAFDGMLKFLKGRVVEWLNERVPPALRNPVGWLARRGCEALNLCAAQLG